MNPGADGYVQESALSSPPQTESIDTGSAGKEELLVGAYVVLQSLKNTAKFNGHLGQIQSLEAETQRYIVNIGGVQESIVQKSIKRDNLREEVPNSDFKCPITQNVPENPVRVFGDVTCQVYDKSTIEKWVREKNSLPTAPAGNVISDMRKSALLSRQMFNLTPDSVRAEDYILMPFPYKDWLEHQCEDTLTSEASVEGGRRTLREMVKEEVEGKKLMDRSLGAIVFAMPNEDASMPHFVAMVHESSFKTGKLQVVSEYNLDEFGKPIPGAGLHFSVDWRKVRLMVDIFDDIGKSATMKGLQQRPELNGAKGRLSGFDTEKGRYQVELVNSDASSTDTESHQQVSVRQSNFELALHSGVTCHEEIQLKRKYIRRRLDSARKRIFVWSLDAVIVDSINLSKILRIGSAEKQFIDIRQWFTQQAVPRWVMSKYGRDVWRSTVADALAKLEQAHQLL